MAPGNYPVPWSQGRNRKMLGADTVRLGQALSDCVSVVRLVAMSWQC